MGRIAIIVGHPRKDTYCEALGRAYEAGARAGGHETRLFVLARMSFDPILHEGFKSAQPLEPDLEAAQAAIGWADHTVWICPLWMGSLPALLKGFIERIFQPGFAFAEAGAKGWRPLLRGKSARIIMTMGMPGLVYRWWFGAHALKAFRRNILEFCGMRPVRTTLHGMIEAVPDERRRRWLDEAEAMGRRGY